MPRTIDQIRASKLPSNMMQFAARGALQVPAAENIEILVHLARHNPVFGEVAKMTLAGWDEKSSIAAAADPQTPSEVLNYFVSPDNLRPKLFPALLENPSISEGQLVKVGVGASKELIEMMLASSRVRSLNGVLQALLANPYLEKPKAEELRKLLATAASDAVPAQDATQDNAPAAEDNTSPVVSPIKAVPAGSTEALDSTATAEAAPDPEADAVASAYFEEHAEDIAAQGEKPFQAIGGIVELLGENYFPVHDVAQAPAPEPAAAAPAAPAAAPAKKPAAPAVRENALQKINRLDIKGRIQLALKGNKEERSLLIRDGTKVVALAVLEAPKLSDGEVEKFASQKNVLEAVLRQIPLKRKFMKNYKVVRNLVANPRTPLDLALGLMKHLLSADLKAVSGNKEVPETVRKLAMKMFKQKEEQAAKK
ncbi:MAG TPA: hypothetical protein VGM18_10020 [Candidatus Sulfotelmatobacter sp.]|jgi:hypothetical protein